MQTEQTSKDSKKVDTHEPSLKKMMKKDLSEGPKVTEQINKQGNNVNGQSTQNQQIVKIKDNNDDSSSSDHIVLKRKEGYQTADLQNSAPQNISNKPESDDDDVQIISVSNPTKNNNAVPQRKESGNGNGSNSKQKKKNTNRCKVCKKGGSTSSFKPCKDCARLFHYECIGMKKDLDKDKKYICDQCKDKQKQKRAVEREKEKKKKQKEKEKEKERQLKLESILAEAKKKLEKPKDSKKEETLKFIEEFQAKYPQLVENKKIKFPIEDTLLTIYGEKFQDNQNLAKRPRPQQSKIIPQEYMNDILMIWNFLNSFSEHLENMKFTKEQLYIAMDHKGEESHALLNHIFRNLVRFPVLDIYYTHKIDNHKELSDQPFFIITRVAKEIDQLDTVMQVIWPEFIRHLSYFQQYSINFKDDQNINEILEIMKNKDFSSFYDLDTKHRIKFMALLIACVDDSDSFHDGVIGFKQEQVHEMTKERNDLQVEIKKDELEFQALDAKVKALEQVQKEQSAAILETLSRAESLKKSKELEKEKKELQKIKNQASKLEQALIKKKNKCQQLTYDLPHYINTAQLLGYDHNKSEFWFFHNDRKTIYLRYKESIIDDDRTWCYYNTKEDITNLIKSLNKKGIREKNLYDNLMYLVKNGYLQYKFEDFEKKPNNQANQANTNGTSQKVEGQQTGGIQTTLQFNAKEGLTITQNGENPQEEKKDMEIEEIKKPEDAEQKSAEQNGEAQKNMEDEAEVEETKEQIIQYLSNYDPQAIISKTAQTSTKKKAKGSQQNDKDLSVFQRAKSNYKDIGMIILETEKNFTDYLEKRRCRWANKNNRESFRERVKNVSDPQEIFALLEQLNEGFSAVDHMFIKENAKILENEEESQKMEQEDNEEDNQSVDSDDESFQGLQKNKNGKNSNQNQSDKALFTLEFFESHPQMRSKKLPMRIWGIYSEKCKKNWQNMPMINIMSAYLSSYLFCSIVQRFLQRKKEQYQEKLLQEQNNQLPSFYVADDKKSSGLAASANQKKKNINYNDFDSYKYTDNSLRRSDRQKYRKDLSEPNYDLEDFEEEEQEESRQKEDQDNEDQEEEYRQKSTKVKKNSRFSKNKDTDEYDEEEENEEQQEDEEEEYDASKIEEEEQLEESRQSEEDKDENGDEDDEEQEDNKKSSKKQAKRKLTKSKDLKKQNKKNENEEDNQEQDEEDEQAVKPKILKKGKAKLNKNAQKIQDSDEEEEFQFYKQKDEKNDKKQKHLESNDEPDNEEEEEFSFNKNKNSTKLNSKKQQMKNNQDWDEQCKVCGQHGEVLMCDTCPSVFHLKCIGLKSLPDGDWSCLECQQKLLKQRQTRSSVKRNQKN
ncbi:PHD-finger protein (macronuclear) [Tetrahymena thermophila SB210]|uniref:PHD-finger protein n=1 Tax=Tetrahymena thermophila (strain SB210) TaxID=312017 RepID=I7MJ69_TETTS|nr:PHD-finger protein [Tetrahymena thermophila SB210]EAS05159.2 PHD-finger protein [Tetrahymena thermophila SB210]|eukprot:XP_001025404.2 PHD-finger protein [Tetrahymena thermophila SB210]